MASGFPTKSTLSSNWQWSLIPGFSSDSLAICSARTSVASFSRNKFFVFSTSFLSISIYAILSFSNCATHPFKDSISESLILTWVFKSSISKSRLLVFSSQRPSLNWRDSFRSSALPKEFFKVWFSWSTCNFIGLRQISSEFTSVCSLSSSNSSSFSAHFMVLSSRPTIKKDLISDLSSSSSVSLCSSSLSKKMSVFKESFESSRSQSSTIDEMSEFTVLESAYCRMVSIWLTTRFRDSAVSSISLKPSCAWSISSSFCWRHILVKSSSVSFFSNLSVCTLNECLA